MSRFHALRMLRPFALLVGAGIAISFIFLNTKVLRSMQNPALPVTEKALTSSPAASNGSAITTDTSAKDPKKARLEQTKSDAAELSALADQLREELGKMNANVLSLDVIQKTQKVERLAKKIKGEANGD
jgi:hypothetical protein